jgi:hypothetical protein
MPGPGFPADVPSCPSPLPAALRQVALHLDRALADTPPGGAMALFLAGPPPTAEAPGAGTLGLLDLQGLHPAEALLGFVAPDPWWAMGTYCSGRALGVDPACGYVARRGRRPRGRPVRLVSLVARSGAGAGALRRAGGRGGPEPLDEPPTGLVGDCLRRALGVPTPPPPATSVAWWLAVWLDRVVRALLDDPPGGSPTAGEPPPRTWDGVASRHPAASAVDGGRGVEPARLAAATCDLAGRWPWARLRTGPGPALAGVGAGAASSHDHLRSLPPPDIAAWMDDGMFARWCAGALPDLLDACAHLLPPGVWGAVDAAVTAAGAEVPAPGDPTPGGSGPDRGELDCGEPEGSEPDARLDRREGSR